MVRRLFSLVFKLLSFGLVLFLLTAAWIIFDGVIDSSGRTDVALVLGHSEPAQGVAEKHREARLDRAAQLYRDNQFPFIIVSGAVHSGGENEAERMAHGLEVLGIPASAIIIDRQGDNTQVTARHVAEIMKRRQFHSLMLVTDYYHMTRAKLALRHEGVSAIETDHAGNLRKEDAYPIAREVIALYVYLAKYYLLPAAEKAGDEAKVGLDQAKVEAEKAKNSVDKKLDSMSK